MPTLNDRCLQDTVSKAYILSMMAEQNMRPELGYLHVLDQVFENKED